MKLRVATYNIHKGVTGIRGRPRIHDVKVALNSIDADIVFLQEVQDRNEMLRHHANYPSARQLDFLAGGGYDHLAYGMNAVYPHGHHGNAILSRHTIGRFANHDISDHALERRGMLHAVSRVLPPRGRRVREVHLICVHFGLIKRSRLRQASQLADFVDQEIPEGAPLIIAGDFNDWQRRVDELLRGRLDVKEVSFSDLGANGSPWAAHRSVLDRVLPWRKGRDDAKSVSRTFPSFAPWLTLDRIYVRGFAVRGIEVPKGLAWAKRSDHAPLIADLELK
jgi:endonuclease/exonuclease/phosphatase family metal-dependent hydrolase